MRLSLLLAALLLASCDTLGSPGSYDVRFRDLDGTEVSLATLDFDRPGVGEETDGTYRYVSGLRLSERTDLRAVGQPDGTVSIDMDLNVDDGGVGLVGPFSDGASEGTWGVGTIAGYREAGTFRAERR